MEEVKYPVKYALMPVEAYITNKRGEEFVIDKCYIISKAYVLEEHRKYQEDGTYSVKYQICFPYKVYTEGISSVKTTPHLHSSSSNNTLAFYLFDSYEEALIAKEKKNALIPNEVVDQYQSYEDRIQELTKDMLIDPEKEDFNNIIRGIQAYLLKERGKELSYEDIISTLGLSMNSDDLGKNFLIEEFEKGETISQEQLLYRYLDNRSMEEVLNLYDYLDCIGRIESQNNSPKIKKKSLNEEN